MPFSFLFSEPDGVHVYNKNCHTDYNFSMLINTTDVQAAAAEHQLGKTHVGCTWIRGLFIFLKAYKPKGVCLIPSALTQTSYIVLSSSYTFIAV